MSILLKCHPVMVSDTGSPGFTDDGDTAKEPGGVHFGAILSEKLLESCVALETGTFPI